MVRAVAALAFLCSACSGWAQGYYALSSSFPLAAIPAPITFTELLTNNSTANAAEYTTSSFTISANKLVLAFVLTSDTVTPDDHVLSSLHGTWTQIANTNFNNIATPGLKLSCWRTLSATSQSSTLTNKFSNGANGCGFYVAEFGGVDTSGSGGSGAIVQVVMSAADSTANPSVTLAALSGTRNTVIAAFGNAANPFAATAEAGWIEQFDSGYSTPSAGFYVTYATNTTDNTVLTTKAAGDFGGIAVEIKNK